MTIKDLQKQLEKEKAILKDANDRIAIQNKELETLRDKVQSNNTEEALNDANNRLTELISHLQNGIFVVDENRKIVILNKLFCKLLGIKAKPETLIGTEGAKVIDQIKHLFKDPEQFSARIEEIFKNREAVINE